MKKIFLLAICLSLMGAGEASQPVFIKDATLITVTQGTTKGSLLIEDGKIKALGANIAPPEGARIIDANGKFVSPGLIDPHSHIGVYSFPGGSALSDGNEATAPITPQVRAMDSFNVNDPAIPRAWLGGVAAVQVLPGSANCIGGQSAVIKLRYGVPIEEMLIKDALKGMKMAMGENPKRVYGSRGQMPSTRMGSAAVMRQAFVDAQDYIERHERFRRGEWADAPPETDLKLEALAGVLKGDIMPNVHGYTVSDLFTIFRIADEFSFKIRSIHHSLEAYKITDELAKREVFVVIFPDMWGFKHEAYYASDEAPSILRRAGVKVCFHTDHPVIEQRYLIFEAGRSTRYGLSEEDAFKAITLYPAELLGIAHRMGSLETGKDADVVIWSGHPFEISSKVEILFIDGEAVYEKK